MEEAEDKKTEVTLTNVSFLTNNQIEANVDKMTGDMKFFSIFYIVYGVLMCLTIIGAIIGVPMIIYHLKLNESAQSYRKFVKSKDFFHLHRAIEDQQKFFFFYKVLIIIGLVIFALYIIGMIYLFSWGYSSLPQEFV